MESLAVLTTLCNSVLYAEIRIRVPNPERGPDSQRDEELLQCLVVLLQVSVARRPANNPIAKTTFQTFVALF